jgi:hypothetical protein
MHIGSQITLKTLSSAVTGFLVTVIPVLAYTKTAWIRSDQFCRTETEALGPKKLGGTCLE